MSDREQPAGDGDVPGGPGQPPAGPAHSPRPQPPDPQRTTRLSRRRALGVLTALGALLLALVALADHLLRRRGSPDEPTPSPGEQTGDGDVVLLDVAGADGRLLGLDELLLVATNGAGADERDDALLDADTLAVLSLAPLDADASASARLELPRQGRACLSISWPTSAGYSALLVDLPGPGRYALAELAAQSLHASPAAAEADGLIDPVTGAGVGDLRAATEQALASCRSAPDDAQRAARASQALEAAASAQVALDRARAHHEPGTAMLGVTFTYPPDPAAVAAALEPLRAAQRGIIVRLVVTDTDDHDEMAAWRTCLDELHAQGAQAMVQVCDSQAVASLDDAAWRRRLSRLLEAFPDADAWETGNEIGGEWLGERGVTRAREAARALARDPATAQATRVLTLYYQLGQGEAEASTFTVAGDALEPGLLELSDVVGLSVYPQWHPLGVSADRVLDALSQVAQGRPIALTELGYGAEDLDEGPWWYGSPTDTTLGRESVARDLTASALCRQDVWAAPMWWYYLEDEEGAGADDGVGSTLAEAAQAPQAQAPRTQAP